jgi:tetratricopeptide (TPR) repeat protein
MPLQLLPRTDSRGIGFEFIFYTFVYNPRYAMTGDFFYIRPAMKYLLLIGTSLILLTCSCGNKGSKKGTGSGTDTISAELKAINELLRETPGNAKLYVSRAKYYMNKKDFNAAQEDMSRAISIDSTRADFYLTLADLYFMVNKTGGSKTALEKCHQLDPSNSDCIMKLAELYFYVRKYQESLNFLDEALKLDQYNSKAYFMKGMNFKESGDTTKAISSMQTAVEQDNAYYNAYIQLGLLCGAKHNPLAEDYYMNALRLQPRSPEALYDFAKYLQDLKDYPRATALYKQLLALNDKSFDALYNLGVIGVNQKNYTEASGYFTRAITAEPRNPRGYYGRGYCYQLMGETQNATSDYRYTLTLDPEFELAKEALLKLKAN